MKKDYSLKIFTMEPLELEAGKSLLSAIMSETESGRAMVICRHHTRAIHAENLISSDVEKEKN